jgi:hypothetical protein
MTGAQWQQWFFDALATFGDLKIIDESRARFQGCSISVKNDGRSVSIRAYEGATGTQSTADRTWQYDLSTDPAEAASDVAEDLP